MLSLPRPRTNAEARYNSSTVLCGLTRAPMLLAPWSFLMFFKPLATYSSAVCQSTCLHTPPCLSTDRADVDHVARQPGVHRITGDRCDLRVLAAMDHAQLHHAGHFLAKAHAAGAMDATAHFLHGNQRADILDRHHALFFFVARRRAAIAHGQVLQLAFTALVADGAIQRVVDQQELHDRLLGFDGLVALGAHDHALRHRRSARWHGLGSLFHIHQAHTAVGSDRKLLVVAEMRNVGARLLGR